MQQVSIEVAYSQVAVFVATLVDPFNTWTDAHVAQGFSWRPGSVSFKTLDEGGSLMTTVEVGAAFDIHTSSAARVIQVPFAMSECAEVELASPGCSFKTDLKPGNYELTFAHGKNGAMWCVLYFRPVDDVVDARVLRADSELSPGEALVMAAEPA